MSKRFLSIALALTFVVLCFSGLAFSATADDNGTYAGGGYLTTGDIQSPSSIGATGFTLTDGTNSAKITCLGNLADPWGHQPDDSWNWFPAGFYELKPLGNNLDMTSNFDLEFDATFTTNTHGSLMFDFYNADAGVNLNYRLEYYNNFNGDTRGLLLGPSISDDKGDTQYNVFGSSYWNTDTTPAQPVTDSTIHCVFFSDADAQTMTWAAYRMDGTLIFEYTAGLLANAAATGYYSNDHIDLTLTSQTTFEGVLGVSGVAYTMDNIWLSDEANTDFPPTTTNADTTDAGTTAAATTPSDPTVASDWTLGGNAAATTVGSDFGVNVTRGAAATMDYIGSTQLGGQDKYIAFDMQYDGTTGTKADQSPVEQNIRMRLFDSSVGTPPEFGLRIKFLPATQQFLLDVQFLAVNGGTWQKCTMSQAAANDWLTVPTATPTSKIHVEFTQAAGDQKFHLVVTCDGKTIFDTDIIGGGMTSAFFAGADSLGFTTDDGTGSFLMGPIFVLNDAPQSGGETTTGVEIPFVAIGCVALIAVMSCAALVLVRRNRKEEEI